MGPGCNLFKAGQSISKEGRKTKRERGDVGRVSEGGERKEKKIINSPFPTSAYKQTANFLSFFFFSRFSHMIKITLGHIITMN